MVVLLLLVACVGGAVWRSAEAQDAYDLLPADYKKGVDLALAHLNSHAVVQHHFRFLRSLEKSDAEVNNRALLWRPSLFKKKQKKTYIVTQKGLSWYISSF